MLLNRGHRQIHGQFVYVSVILSSVVRVNDEKFTYDVISLIIATLVLCPCEPIEP